MLLPEAPLDVLVDQLKTMPRADRAAVLARLSGEERRRVSARIAGRRIEASSPYSSAIAARLALLDAPDCPLAPATRRTLATIAGPGNSGAATDSREVSLLHAIAGLLRPVAR